MRAAALLLLASTSVAAAEPARLAAVAAGDDALAAVMIGPNGQVFAPSGHGEWLRTQGGGIGGDVAVATRAGADVLVGAPGGPPYRFDGKAWASVYLAMHAKAVVARGHRPVAAVGRQVFALDGAQPARLPDAPGAVLAIGASGSGVAIATDRGVSRLEGGKWKLVDKPGAPRSVVALASDRWAITADGAYDLVANHATTWQGVTAFAADGDTLMAATQTELLTLHAGKLTREPLAASAAPPVGIAFDHGHTVVALADGHVLVRVKDAWSTTEVSDALPAGKPGSGPATAD